MLDWLKRKSAPAPSAQLVESEGQKPLTDVRLERMLGRLGPDGRTPGAAVEAPGNIDPPRSPAPGAEAPKEIAPPPNVERPPPERIATREPVAEAVPPGTGTGGYARVALRRED